MAALGSILAYQFRGYPEEGWAVQQGDDGVAFIVRWDEALMGRPMPTGAEIDSWNLVASKYYQRRTINRMADIDYDAIFAIDGREMSRKKDRLIIKMARGQVLTNGEIAARDRMIAIDNAADAKIVSINNATTVAQVEAVTWP